MHNSNSYSLHYDCSLLQMQSVTHKKLSTKVNNYSGQKSFIVNLLLL